MIEAIQIFLMIIFAIIIVVCFTLFAFDIQSNWGNWGGFFLFLGAFNLLIAADRD